MLITRASDLLLKARGGNRLVIAILQLSDVLDNAGAWTWKYRDIAIVTAMVLGAVRWTFGKKGGIDWFALLHALVSGLGSLACIYLERVASVPLTGIPEPFRTMQCHGPLSSLHRILPAVTLGYSIFDLLDGLHLGLDFAVHGTATALVMAFFCYIDAPQILAANLTMEVSTIFLTMVRATFFPEFLTIANMGMFALTFFIFRVALGPYFWWLQITSMWENKSTEAYQACFPPSMAYFAFFLGLVFHALNYFWFYKILRKIKRKIKGEEGTRANNELNEQDALDEMKKKLAENGDASSKQKKN